MGTRKRARILIADRERLFADAVAVEVMNAGFDVVEVCETIDRAASRIAEGGVDLVIIDPEVDGGDDSTAYELLSEDPSVKLILMSATLDYERVSRAVTLGYRGVVSKNARLARLIEALSSVENGDVTIETAAPRGAEPPSRRLPTIRPVDSRRASSRCSDSSSTPRAARRSQSACHSVRTPCGHTSTM